MSGKKEMKKYPFGVREEVVSRIRAGESQSAMSRNLYDNSIVAYKTWTQQTVNLVMDTIRLAMKREKKGPLRSSTSTATKGSSIPHKHTALLRLCQGKEIRMTTPWRKTSSPF